MKTFILAAALLLGAQASHADFGRIVLAEGFVSTTAALPNGKNADNHLFLSEDGQTCVRSRTTLENDGVPEASPACEYLKASREAGQELARLGFSYAPAENFGLGMVRVQNEYTFKNRVTAGVHAGQSAVLCVKETLRSFIFPQAYVSFTAKLIAVPAYECAATFKTSEERRIVTAVFNKYGF